MPSYLIWNMHLILLKQEGNNMKVLKVNNLCIYKNSNQCCKIIFIFSRINYIRKQNDFPLQIVKHTYERIQIDWKG